LRKPGWPKAPKLIEEIYNFEDALVVGGALIAMINNADRVKTACLAQLVNVIGPIMTETGGAAWRQTIFHPFALASKFARGEVLRTKVESASYATETHPDLPYVLACVLADEDGGVTILALNRHTKEESDVEVELRGFGGRHAIAHALELHHRDLKAVNTVKATAEVAPQQCSRVTMDRQTVRATLKPLSWNVIAAKRA
jgi:alpha-N-arabinofuranosidase